MYLSSSFQKCTIIVAIAALIVGCDKSTHAPTSQKGSNSGETTAQKIKSLVKEQSSKQAVYVMKRRVNKIKDGVEMTGPRTWSLNVTADKITEQFNSINWIDSESNPSLVIQRSVDGTTITMSVTKSTTSPGALSLRREEHPRSHFLLSKNDGKGMLQEIPAVTDKTDALNALLSFHRNDEEWKKAGEWVQPQ